MAIKVGGTTVVDDSRNITGISISGLTTPLSVAQGGTGTASTAHTSLTTNVSGTLPIANGGTGTTSTAYASLTTNVSGTLPVANGGTGTASPAIVAGTGISVSGSFPNQTITNTGATTGKAIAMAMVFGG